MKTTHVAIVGIIFILAGCVASSAPSLSSPSQPSQEQIQKKAHLLMEIMTDMNNWAPVLSKASAPPEAWRSPISNIDRKFIVPKLKELSRTASNNPEFIMAYDSLLVPESPYEITEKTLALYKDKMEDMEMLMHQNDITPEGLILLDTLHRECIALVAICETWTIKYLK